MTVTADPHTSRRLVRNLVLVVVVALLIYALFTVINQKYALFRSFTGQEILLLEAGAVVLVAYLVAAAFTSAVDEVLRRRGQVQHGATIRIFLNLIISVVALLAIFEISGVSVESIFLGSAFVGIVLGLAAQTVLANVFAGLLLVVANPFRPGDRVSFISASYGAFAPSYPHEMLYPSYSGTVEDVELLYTILRLDTGGVAKIPNSVVVGALVHQPKVGAPKAHRIRMTFPFSVSVATVESALADISAAFPEDAARTPPRVEVTDVSVASWDAVVVLWSPTLNDGMVRDRVMRAVLAHYPPPNSTSPAK